MPTCRLSVSSLAFLYADGKASAFAEIERLQNLHELVIVAKAVNKKATGTRSTLKKASPHSRRAIPPSDLFWILLQSKAHLEEMDGRFHLEEKAMCYEGSDLLDVCPKSQYG